MSLFFYLFTLAINLWHRKFFSADVTAVFVVGHAWACPFPQKIALGMGRSESARVVRWLDHSDAMCSRAWCALCSAGSRFNSNRELGKAHPPM